MQILLTGVILAPGRRTVTSALYTLGLQAEGDWARYHHVLSQASWSTLAVSRVLLAELVQHLVPTGPLHLAIDETLERRWGAKIETLGVYRDPVRSQLTESLPPKWGQLASLEALNLADNQLTGPLPTELGQLTNLTHVHLEDNPMTGCLPPAWQELRIHIPGAWQMNTRMKRADGLRFCDP